MYALQKRMQILLLLQNSAEENQQCFKISANFIYDRGLSIRASSQPKPPNSKPSSVSYFCLILPLDKMKNLTPVDLSQARVSTSLSTLTFIAFYFNNYYKPSSFTNLWNGPELLSACPTHFS